MDDGIPMAVDLFATAGLIILLVVLFLMLFPFKVGSSPSALADALERPGTVRSFHLDDPKDADLVLRVTFLCGRRAVVAHGDEALRVAETLGNRGVPISGPDETT